MRSVSGVGRVAALGAIIAAIALVAIVLFGGVSDSYRVTGRFLNAGQLVKGNPVQVSGLQVGSVKNIRITPNGLADIELEITDEKYVPLRQGTKAQIRQFSQSGIANRYVNLEIPPNGTRAITDKGFIGTDSTTTQVDLDELFNTLDPPTRRALQGFFKGQARMFAGRSQQANVGFHYLNPALSTSSRLFNEFTRDTPLLERFLIDSSKLVTALAEKRDDLAALIGNLNGTFRALGNQKQALADSVGELPPFMRRANTTFVNLRAALDDVDPLVDASKPVARKLGPFLRDARLFARDARPTIRDLQLTIRRSGARNDLIDLLGTIPPLYDIAIVKRSRSVSPGRHRVNVGNVPGAFEEIAEALREGGLELGIARPYTSDLMGWFDDFSTTGAGFDALGSLARGQVYLSESIARPDQGAGLGPVRRDQFRRCPGASEYNKDGSNFFSAAERADISGPGGRNRGLACEETDRAVGDVP